jgi:universal stress protein E
MLKMKSILLATDFCPASIEATEAAATLASMFGARVSLLHVFRPSGMSAEGGTDERNLAQWQIQELATQLAAKSVAVDEAKVIEGHPVEGIVDEAQKIDADLVLIGAGKWGRSEPFQSGPIAEAVLQFAHSSVLAVRSGVQSTQFDRILCPVDQSPASRFALQTCIDLARTTGGVVHVVTVVPEITWQAAALKLTAASRAEFKDRWHREFEQFLASILTDGVAVTREIRHGITHEEIVESAEQHRSDLIVMGSTGRTGLARFLMGSVTRRVLRNLPCSLWSVKKAELVEEQVFEQDLQHIRLLMAEARALLEAGQYQPALLKFRQVTARNPLHGEALEGQAVAYEHLGLRDEARTFRDRAEKVLEPIAACSVGA